MKFYKIQMLLNFYITIDKLLYNEDYTVIYRTHIEKFIFIHVQKCQVGNGTLK